MRTQTVRRPTMRPVQVTPLRIMTLDCLICEEPTPHNETPNRDAFVCSKCLNEFAVIVMNTPPMRAFL
jgi:hypothetical protein